MRIIPSHANVLCGHVAQFPNGRKGGMYSYHSTIAYLRRVFRHLLDHGLFHAARHCGGDQMLMAM